MKKSLPPFLKNLTDYPTYLASMSIFEDHFYGISRNDSAKGTILRGRHSPSGETPLILKVDTEHKTLMCTCALFQKKAGYPARMGLPDCPHLVRFLTLSDSELHDTFDFPEKWRGVKASPEIERDEIVFQAKFFLDHGDILSACTELYYGIIAANLTDMDVSRVLGQVDASLVTDDELPEAMRFVRIALQKGFTRNTWDLASAWIKRFAAQVDRYEPFLEAAPVALWLMRWGQTPDVHFTEVREMVLSALKTNGGQKTGGASWWLLYRSVSRGGKNPPKSCVDAWHRALSQMRLSLVHPNRINEAAKLIGQFGIVEQGAGESYVNMHKASIRRAREIRMNHLLRLTKAHQLKPFLEIHLADYFPRHTIWAVPLIKNGPLDELILNSIGHKGDKISVDDFVENWPIIQRCITNPESPDAPLKEAIKKMWPETVTPPPPTTDRPGLESTVPRIPRGACVVRWALSAPGLIANSPIVAHHDNRIYIPARGGSDYPEAFGLALCKEPAAMGRRLFTVPVVQKLNPKQALTCLKQGANWIGPKDDPVVLLSQDPGTLGLFPLFKLPGELEGRQKRLARMPWFPDRAMLNEMINPRFFQIRAWARRRLYEALMEGVAIRDRMDIGIMFARGISLVPTLKNWEKIRAMSRSTADFSDWMAKLSKMTGGWLAQRERPEDPVNLKLLVGSPLERSIPIIVNHRKKQIDLLRFEQVGRYFELGALKKTVYGWMLLCSMRLDHREKLTRNEADRLIKALRELHPGTDSLPLFSRENTITNN